MFNVNSKVTAITVTYNLSMVEFDISALVSKHNKKEELISVNNFMLLNAYVDWKGDAFKQKLCEEYIAAKHAIDLLPHSNPLYPTPTHIIRGLCELITVSDAYHFIKDVYRLPSLSSLKDSFDHRFEQNDQGSRDQTYLKADYLELCALVLVCKTILPILSQVAYVHGDELSPHHKHYALFGIIQNTPSLYNTQPMQKLLGFINKLVEQDKTQDAALVTTIGSMIPSDDIPLFLLASVVLVNVSTYDVTIDTDEKNIVKKIHRWVINHIAPTSNKVLPKRPITTSGESPADESQAEAFRKLGNLSEGAIVEYKWCTNSIEIILHQLKLQYTKPDLPGYIPEDILNIGITTANQMDRLNSAQVVLLGVIFKDMISPHALNYLELSHIKNMLAVGFTILWVNNHKDIAVLLLSTAVESEITQMHVNVSSQKSRPSADITEKVKSYFPHCRKVNANTTVNIVIAGITKLSNEILAMRWVPRVPRGILSELGDLYQQVVPKPDIKISIMELVVWVEERRITYVNIATNNSTN